jgi:hypothetical protein
VLLSGPARSAPHLARRHSAADAVGKKRPGKTLFDSVTLA